MPTLHLDLRDLPPPLPMQRILEALDEPLQGGALTAQTPFWPAPLIDRLRLEGYAVEGRVEPDGSAWIAIHVPAAA
jgi:uncharacterized protein (DUF2249 family)